jgi:hypothetical protein
MSISNTQDILYKGERAYPRYQTIRIQRSTVSMLKKRGISGDSLDTIINRLFKTVSEFKKRGYETTEKSI